MEWTGAQSPAKLKAEALIRIQSAGAGIRPPDPRLKRPLLCQAELHRRSPILSSDATRRRVRHGAGGAPDTLSDTPAPGRATTAYPSPASRPPSSPLTNSPEGAAGGASTASIRDAASR